MWAWVCSCTLLSAGPLVLPRNYQRSPRSLCLWSDTAAVVTGQMSCTMSTNNALLVLALKPTALALQLEALVLPIKALALSKKPRLWCEICDFLQQLFCTFSAEDNKPLYNGSHTQKWHYSDRQTSVESFQLTNYRSSQWCLASALALRPKFSALALKLKSLALQPEALVLPPKALTLLCLSLALHLVALLTSRRSVTYFNCAI